MLLLHQWRRPAAMWPRPEALLLALLLLLHSTACREGRCGHFCV